MQIVNFIKKYWIISLITLIVLIGAFIILLLFNQSNEKELKSLLKSTSIEFYENYYYDLINESQTERETFLKKYTNHGININLVSLSRVNSDKINFDNNKYINNKTKEECNPENTKAIIYPKEPFGKKDYTIEIKLDCGF